MSDQQSSVAQFEDAGFEYEGEFYRWHVSDVGKDLMLIDRFSGMPITDFFDLVEDEHERTRAPVLLSLVACSIRAKHPDWSVERIARKVLDLELSALVFINGDEAGTDDSPLPELESPTPLRPAESSRSTPNDSSPSSTQEETSSSETSYATPV